ncbi:MAG: replication factor C large subunit [Candidatus Bathyarchaeia archaeon]|nr:replication factor C large subunit [Candidatus Bathyarchaeota archaeon]
MSIPWIIKYRPKHLNDVVNNEEAKEKLLKWIKSLEQGKNVKKAALLYGPPGTGKTVTVEALAKDFGYDLIEINASDKRNSEELMRIAGSAATQGELLSKKRLILLDEIDGINLEEDKGAVAAVNQILKEAKHPIILTANDPWDPKIAPLRNSCELIEFKRLSLKVCIPYLKKICLNEGVKPEDEALKFIIEKNNGDMRSIVNDLEALCVGRKELTLNDVSWISSRDRKENIFTALTLVFSGKNCVFARKAIDMVDIDYEMFFEWIYENAPYQLTNVNDLCNAMEALAKANLYLTRIKKYQNWNLLPYALNLMTVGVCASKKSKSKFTPFKFPERIKVLSQSKIEREIKNRLGRIIGEEVHLSNYKSIKYYLPYLKFIFKHNQKLAEKISKKLNFDEEIVRFLKQ